MLVKYGRRDDGNNNNNNKMVGTFIGRRADAPTMANTHNHKAILNLSKHYVPITTGKDAPINISVGKCSHHATGSCRYVAHGEELLITNNLAVLLLRLKDPQRNSERQGAERGSADA